MTTAKGQVTPKRSLEVSPKDSPFHMGTVALFCGLITAKNHPSFPQNKPRVL